MKSLRSRLFGTIHPVEAAFLGLLYGWGVYLWGMFLNWGRIPLDWHDWAESNAPRLAFLQDALRRLTFPLHMPGSYVLRGVTDRFFTLPDQIISPQIVLLAGLDVPTFILINTLLLYTLGFLGLLALRQRYGLAPLAFAGLFFIFNFNGHILTHTTVGHITWGGHFFFPWLALLALRLAEGEGGWKWITQTALLLWAMMLQGSFHHFVWACLFLGLLALPLWKRLPAVTAALAFGVMLSLFQLLPPSLNWGKFDQDFLGGYPMLRYLPDAMLNERLPDMSALFQAYNSRLGWWEYDLYIGYAGAAFLLGGLALWAGFALKRRTWGHLSVLLPLAALTFFATGERYRLIANLNLPLFSSDRVSARMVILPLVMGAVLAALGWQQGWQAFTSQLQGRWAWVRYGAAAGMLPGVGLLGWDVSRHAVNWSVLKAYPHFPHTPLDLTLSVVANRPDPPYIELLALGGGLSLLALAVLLWLYRRFAAKRPAR
ncbi:MAG TPA: hypothetical protein VIO61_06295 [Anaerolineaceae bacterium]